ncbi:MAG: divalent-cation tolerance protein CutA [Opitutaceae bacterium]|nr:divalent-cation tolerance protein CutA [Opitutaceae bacterium]
MFVAWTTTSSRDDADRLARGAIECCLAACAQVEGPITSFYRWEGRLESATEFRVCFKCLPVCVKELEKWVLANHPYGTPEWIAVRAEAVGEKYLSWAQSSSTSAPFTESKNP